MKVVRHKSTGKIIYSQTPDFEPGKGIENVRVLYDMPAEELEEVEITQQEWEHSQLMYTVEEKQSELGRPIIKALISAIEQKLSIPAGELHNLVKEKLEQIQ